MIDGRVGGNDFRLGEWQGYYGVNLEAIVDLGNLQPVRQVKINFLQDVNSWIFMPSKVQVLISSDGIHFSPSGTITTHTREDDWKINIEPFLFPINGTSARFVKVIGYTNTYCPAWHKGAGNLSFIFADEIQIE